MRIALPGAERTLMALQVEVQTSGVRTLEPTQAPTASPTTDDASLLMDVNTIFQYRSARTGKQVYLRNIMSMASATTGVAMQQMLATKEVDPYSKIIEAATKAVGDAQTTFSKVGTSASSVVKDFDNLA